MMDSSALTRLLPHLATLLAAAVLGYVIMQNLDLLLPAPTDAPAEAAGPAVASMAPRAGSTTDLAQLSGWHLFGQEQQQGSNMAPPVQQITAPKTRLQLSLHGVFTPPNRESDGWAIISAPGESEKGYRIGDELPGGVQLYAVETNQVILTRSGQYESLPLPNVSLPDGAMDSYEPPPLPGQQEPESYPGIPEPTMAEPPEMGQMEPSSTPPEQPQIDPSVLERLKADPRYKGLIAPGAAGE